MRRKSDRFDECNREWEIDTYTSEKRKSKEKAFGTQWDSLGY